MSGINEETWDAVVDTAYNHVLEQSDRGRKQLELD